MERSRDVLQAQIMRRIYYIYALSDMDTGRVLYVGATHNPKQRLRQHRPLNSDVRRTARYQEHSSASVPLALKILSVIGPVTYNDPNHPPMSVRWVERSWCRFYATRGPIVNEPGTYVDRIPTIVQEMRKLEALHTSAERRRRAIEELKKPQYAEMLRRLAAGLAEQSKT